MSSEAFLYLWYDAPNKKYYLGKHKGSPDDSYTHSSTVWESFTKSTIPDGVKRRILAYGTNEEISKLEYDLLLNRQQKCWDRYYNVSAGWPIRVDISGPNNPMYGKSGPNNPMYGKKHSEEARKKMSKSQKGKKRSEETRKRMSEAQKGKKHSEEARKKMSESRKGKKRSEETRKRMSEANKGKNNPMYGRKLSEETKKKIAKASSVRKKAYWQAQTEEYKKKTSQNLLNARWRKHREMKEQANV